MKAGEHKGIEIFFSGLSEQFWTGLHSPVKDLIDESYKGIKKQIDAKMEEEGLKYIPNHSPTRKYIDDLFSKYAEAYENVTFKDCVFNMPEGYDKLSAGQKTLIDNLIKEFNEKNI